MHYYQARRNNNPRTSRWNYWKMRWVFALCMAAVGVVIHLARMEVNPVTGERQFVALTIDEEINLGKNAAPTLALQMGGKVLADDPLAALVAKVGHRVVSNSDARSSPFKFEFHLLKNSDMINAFALPGGQIFITRGLLDRLENESQLAGVLGHEIGHVIHRHGAEHMAQRGLGRILARAASTAISDDYIVEKGAHAVAEVAEGMVRLSYQRNDELECDESGLKYITQAGYDPRGMLELMKVLKQAGSSRGIPDFLLTHPWPEDRIQKINELIKTSYPDGIPPQLQQGNPLRALPARSDVRE